MNKIILDDILGFSAYEKVRQQFREDIIEKKKKRRVSVGDKVSIVFENRDTVIFQIQEMLRAERITDLDKIREEIAVYNELIPNPGELSATLFLEIEDQTHLREDLLKFLGIDEAVFFKVGGHVVAGRFEEGRSKEDKISAVQYVRFLFDPEARQALVNGEPAELVIDHPNYQARAVLAAEAQAVLGARFGELSMAKARRHARNTKQLQIIWDTVKDDKSHPTADQIYDRVRKKMPNISLGTVYRNLQKLVFDEKLQVLMRGRSQHFDPLVERHQHFICELCDRVYDVLIDNQREIKPVQTAPRGL